MAISGDFIISRLLRAIAMYIGIIVVTFFVLLIPMFLYGAPPTYLLGEYYIGLGHQDYYVTLTQDIAKWGIVRNPDTAEWINIFYRHIMNCLSGDYGTSTLTLRPVSLVLGERIANTALLVGVSLFASLFIGSGLVAYQEGNRRGKKSWIGQISSLITESTPTYWIGMMLLFAGSYALPEMIGVGFPQFGTISYEIWDASLNVGMGGIMLSIDILFHLILPMLALTMSGSSIIYSILKTNLTENLTERKILTSSANGKSPDYIFYSCLKDSLMIIKNWFPFFISTVMLVEVVFNWRGVGRFMFDSLLRMDYPAIRGIIITLSLFVIVAHFILDTAFYLMTRFDGNLTQVERKYLQSMNPNIYFKNY